jgi:hypothetical protein
VTREDALDRLYQAPLDAFVATRRELAAALKAAGDAAGAAAVAAAKKPSRTAWTLNQMARRHPDALRAAFDAHTAASRAQAHGHAEAVRETVRAFRDALGEIVRRSAALAEQAGVPLSAAGARQLGETVRAAIGGASREQLLAGRLREDVHVDDPLAELEAGPPGPTSSKRGGGAPAARKSGRADDEARSREAERARRKREAHGRAVEEARARVDALEREVREARDTAHHAEVTARRSGAEAERARRTVTALQERLEKARADLRELRQG